MTMKPVSTNTTTRRTDTETNHIPLSFQRPPHILRYTSIPFDNPCPPLLEIRGKCRVRPDNLRAAEEEVDRVAVELLEEGVSGGASYAAGDTKEESMHPVVKSFRGTGGRGRSATRKEEITASKGSSEMLWLMPAAIHPGWPSSKSVLHPLPWCTIPGEAV
jgi:hypothetical protein